jgi:hypothetical protein
VFKFFKNIAFADIVISLFRLEGNGQVVGVQGLDVAFQFVENAGPTRVPGGVILF